MATKKTTADRVQAVAETILEAFRSGELPKALAQVFLNPIPEGSPMAKWSWRNRLLVALRGERDARGFRQWKRIGRSVKKGERAFHILGPVTRTIEEADEATGEVEEKQIVTAFVSIAVFGLSQTEGDPLPDSEATFIEALPVIEVARAWEIEVTAVAFHSGLGTLGTYRPGRITLSVENLSTWGHELVHCADDRLGNRATSPKAEREIVAELGGAVLLECLGYEVESDRGGAWDYIQHHAETSSQAFQLCAELLDRTCAAVSLILTTATELGSPSPHPILTASSATAPSASSAAAV